MFNVTTGPDFHSSFDSNDPLNRILPQVAQASAEALAIQIDTFVRQALKKVFTDEMVELFASERKAIPKLDLRMELLTFNKRKVSVLFRDQELGHATFETRIEPVNLTGVGGEFVITHEIKDVSI